MFLRSLPVALDDLLEQNAIVPVCPAVFIRLTQAISSPDTHQTELAEILSSDAGLTSRILHVANSAFYGAPRQVASIKKAILRLGIREIWAIASALRAKSMFRSGAGWTEFNRVLWEHALRTAALTRVLAQHVRAPNCDETFTAALLHDLGKSVLQSFEPQYALLCQNGALVGRELTFIEADFFGTNHAQLGSELLLHWDLPESIASLVSGHHTQLPPNITKSSSSLLLALANELAHAMAQGASEEGEAINRIVSKQLLDAADLNPKSCLSLMAKATQQFDTLASK